MLIKTYGINGLAEWYGKLTVGTISVDVEFTGGTASPSGARPAYMVVKDPIKQFVIENSKEFKSGFIHLEMQQEVAGSHPRQAVPKNEPTAAFPKKSGVNVKVYPEVTGTQKAIEVLKGLGVDTTNVKTKADAKRIAEELNISFPNL